MLKLATTSYLYFSSTLNFISLFFSTLNFISLSFQYTQLHKVQDALDLLQQAAISLVSGDMVGEKSQKVMH